MKKHMRIAALQCNFQSREQTLNMPEFWKDFGFNTEQLLHTHADMYSAIYDEERHGKLFEEYMDIYMYGRFMDTLGIKYQNNNVLSGVIKGEENSIGIQLYNNSSSSQTVFLEIDLEELGIYGEITSVVNMFDNSVVEIKKNKVTIKMAAEGLVALRVTYEEE